MLSGIKNYCAVLIPSSNLRKCYNNEINFAVVIRASVLALKLLSLPISHSKYLEQHHVSCWCKVYSHFPLVAELNILTFLSVARLHDFSL